MNNFECRDAFLRLEDKAQSIADEFTFQNIPLWQYLRIAFNQRFYNGASSREERPRFDSVHNIFAYHYETLPAGYRVIASLAKGSALIWARGECHNQSIGDKAYDPYLDQVYIECKKLGLNPIKLKMDDHGLDNPLYPVVDIPIFPAAAMPLDIRPIIASDAYQAYLELSRHEYVPNVLAQEFMNLFALSESHRKIYQRILEILQPKIVFLEEYYNAFSMGLSRACRNLDIPCVEYQHGLQNWPHLAYNFPVMPQDGWETVPEWFFMWGQTPARNMQKWFKNQNFHKIDVAGKPNYIAWKTGEVKEDPNLLKEFERSLYGRIPICVTLPFFNAEDKISLLRELIINSPQNWIWLIRRHPLYKNNERSPELDAVIDLQDRIEYELSSKINLHDVLSRSRHILIAHSTAIQEAISLHHLHGTTISESGKKYFWENILDGSLTYATNIHDILKSINQGIEGYPWNPVKPYITSDLTAMSKAIQNVLNYNQI